MLGGVVRATNDLSVADLMQQRQIKFISMMKKNAQFFKKLLTDCCDTRYNLALLICSRDNRQCTARSGAAGRG